MATTERIQAKRDSLLERLAGLKDAADRIQAKIRQTTDAIAAIDQRLAESEPA